jgi:hypothetical protein
MPRVKDIVDRVLAIVYEDLNVEALVQERVERKVKVDKLFKLHNQTLIKSEDYSERTKKRLATLENNKNVRIHSKVFTKTELDIIDVICTVHQLEASDFLSNLRHRDIVNARFQMMAILRNQLYYTFDHIGFIFKKDHSSVIHGIDKHSVYYEVEMNYKNKYNIVLNTIEELHPGLLSEKSQVKVSPKITFINRRINKQKYYKPNGEAVGLKDRDKLKHAKTN